MKLTFCINLPTYGRHNINLNESKVHKISLLAYN